MELEWDQKTSKREETTDAESVNRKEERILRVGAKRRIGKTEARGELFRQRNGGKEKAGRSLAGIPISL